MAAAHRNPLGSKAQTSRQRVGEARSHGLGLRVPRTYVGFSTLRSMAAPPLAPRLGQNVDASSTSKEAICAYFAGLC
jgi:hypothetical protein